MEASRIFGTMFQVWIDTPTEPAARDNEDASGCEVADRTARAGAGNTEERCFPSRAAASRSQRRRVPSDGRPNGTSTATTEASSSRSEASEPAYQVTVEPETSAPTQPPGQPSTPRTAESRDMRVHLGCDHAGFELKEALKARLTELGHEPVDHGPTEYDAADDYPPFCIAAAQATVADSGSLGVVIGGSGNGEQIAANKVKGARCALAHSLETARLARQHNDANVVSVGARMHTEAEALGFVEAFLAEPFSEDPRHIRRIQMLTDYENRA
ncbi:MAG: rpiB [Frankiales bacterium]|nr:rpiB [Frankiales bacterium]